MAAEYAGERLWTLLLDIVLLFAFFDLGILSFLAFLGLHQSLPRAEAATSPCLPLAGAHTFRSEVFGQDQDTLLVHQQGIFAVLRGQLGSRLRLLAFLLFAGRQGLFKALQVPLPHCFNARAFQLLQCLALFLVEESELLDLVFGEGPHLHGQQILEALSTRLLLGVGLDGSRALDVAHVLQPELAHLATEVQHLLLLHVQPVSQDVFHEAQLVEDHSQFSFHLRHKESLPLLVDV
mmetsp:Transcript_38690/g.79066  ORF Transcript_38690/g.79066 Transcript_38690/m.79066 type:complete len:236 (-) Transcript_38690:363-1070(-)